MLLKPFSFPQNFSESLHLPSLSTLKLLPAFSFVLFIKLQNARKYHLKFIEMNHELIIFY